MANRTGIELLPYACRIVTIRTKQQKSGVVAFHEGPYPGADPASLAAELRQAVKGSGRKAAVAVWGLRSTHQAMRLPPAEPRDLEAVARREARAAATGAAAGPLADAVVLGELDGLGQRDVGYAAVGSDELRARLQPLADAGIEIASAVTPAMAHASLVNQRASLPPGTVAAVLSVNAHATALTVVRGRVVLFARELPWGDEDAAAGHEDAKPAAAAVAERLASEVRRSVIYVKQRLQVDVSRVFVCGDVPDPRALTAPLMRDLGIDVETLDVADELGLSDLPEPSDRFRSRLAAWQTALALAADDTAPAVGLRSAAADSSARSARAFRRAFAAAVAALLLVAAGWGLLTYLQRGADTEARRLRRAAAVLEPEMQRHDEAHRQAALAAARSAALDAFASQGPRLAQVLAAFSQAAPGDLALTSLTADPRPGAWFVTAEGQVEGPDAAAAQATFNAFLKALNDSPLLGRPAEPPSLRVRTADAPEEPTPAAAPSEPLPEPAEGAAREVDVRRSAPSGPAYIEVARDGRLYRIPLRRQPGNLELERRNEEIRERQRQAVAAREASAASALRAAAATGDSPARHPASAIDFTLRYEVAK